MIPRPALLKALRDGLKSNPVVALLGPRQCGKTTLARGLAESVTTSYFDLENPADLARLSEPMLALERVKGLAVIDEVQRRPDLFGCCAYWPSGVRRRRASWCWGAPRPSCCARLPKRSPGACALSKWAVS